MWFIGYKEGGGKATASDGLQEDRVRPRDSRADEGLSRRHKGDWRCLAGVPFRRNISGANIGVNRNMAGDNCFTWGAPPGELEKRASIAAGKFIKFVTDLGFSTVNFCYPMSSGAIRSSVEDASDEMIRAVYPAISPDRTVLFTNKEKAALFSGLSSAIAAARSAVRIFTPRSSLYALSRSLGCPAYRSYPCRGGVDFYFASVSGALYPCGYRGNEPLGEMWGEINVKRRTDSCNACEWECFRDPSELFGPIGDVMTKPWRLIFDKAPIYRRKELQVFLF
jgi:hypothetical protein